MECAEWYSARTQGQKRWVTHSDALPLLQAKKILDALAAQFKPIMKSPSPSSHSCTDRERH